MGYLKNIKRNKTRPHASQRPYVQSGYGNYSEKDFKKQVELNKIMAKLDSWLSLK